MSAFNGEAFIAKAIDSICQQTVSDWEFIIVDDKSTDNTKHIIEKFAKRDPRIKLVENNQNRGLTKSLNRGLSMAAGTYIARMDADDISCPARFEKQIKFLESKTDHALVGTEASRIDQDGNVIGRTSLPHNDEEIRARCLFENPFVHPSVMIRSSILERNKVLYDESFETTQDWEFWIRCLQHGKGANLPDIGVLHRQHQDSVSATRKNTQLNNSLRIQKIYLGDLLGAEAWNEPLFREFNTTLLGDRRTSDLLGVDRVNICMRALDFLDLVVDKVEPNISDATAKFLVKRVCLIGLLPPLRNGWLTLLTRLARRWPRKLIVAMTVIFSEKFLR